MGWIGKWYHLLVVGDSLRRGSICFQAEDGIRDLTVTGVQTCALPISNGVSTFSRSAYNWGFDSPGQAQFGGTSIFGPLATCSDPNCAAPGDPQGLSAYSVSQNFRTPYFYNFNLQIEKSLGNAAVFQIGYVGSQGRKLNIISNINQSGAFTHFEIGR